MVTLEYWSPVSQRCWVKVEEGFRSRNSEGWPRSSEKAREGHSRWDCALPWAKMGGDEGSVPETHCEAGAMALESSQKPKESLYSVSWLDFWVCEWISCSKELPRNEELEFSLLLPTHSLALTDHMEFRSLLRR